MSPKFKISSFSAVMLALSILTAPPSVLAAPEAPQTGALPPEASEAAEEPSAISSVEKSLEKDSAEIDPAGAHGSVQAETTSAETASEESTPADLTTGSTESTKRDAAASAEHQLDGSESSEPDYKATVVARRPPPPGTRTEIDRHEMDLRGAANLPEALEMEPSIDVQEGPKSGSVLQIRGFDERAVLVLFEGIPIRESYDGHFNISSLPTFALGRIGVERGMTSLLYGPNSGGGIVSLNAPDACSDTADVRLFAGDPHKGSFLRYGTAGSVCRKVGHFSLFLSGSYDHSDGYVLSKSYSPDDKNAAYHEDGGIRDGSEFSRLSAALLAQYAPERNKKVSFFLNYVHSPRGVPTFEGSGFTRYWKFKEYNTVLAGLSGVIGPKLAPKSWGFRQARLSFYTHQHLDELNDYEDATYSALTSNSQAWFVASGYDNDTYGVTAESSFSLNEGNVLRFSGRYQFDKNVQIEIPVGRTYAKDSWSKPDEFSSHSFGGAIEDSQVAGNWRFLLGAGVSGMKLRSQIYGGKEFEAKDRTIPAVEGRLVIERSVGQNFVLMAAAGRKARLPMLKELYSNSVGGNADLEAEFAWMAETGMDFSSKEIGLEASVRAFFNAIENLIEKRYDTYDNVGKAITAGAEIEAKYSPLSFLQFTLGYRYLYSHDEERNRELDYRTPHKVRLSARWIAPFGLTATVYGIYNATQHAWYTDIDTLIRDTLPGYFLLNASLRYDLTFGKRDWGLYVFANAKNLLDANYSVGSYEPRPGCEFMFGIGGRL